MPKSRYCSAFIGVIIIELASKFQVVICAYIETCSMSDPRIAKVRYNVMLRIRDTINLHSYLVLNTLLKNFESNSDLHL